MDLSKLKNTLKGQPAYRYRQAEQLIFQGLIDDWNQASNLGKDLIERLNSECSLNIEAKIFPDAKGDTIKALINLPDGIKVESVLIEHAHDHSTVCVSSQAGCPLACTFCATGRSGFKRNLTSSEIIEQVLFFARLLKPRGKKINNIVFMGMGEPLLNYDNVVEAIKILNDKNKFNIGARHISVSTIGIVPGIKKLAQENLQINLAVSIHAPSDELRETIVPVNKKYSLKNVINAIDYFLEKTNRKVMIEYVMIKKLNDEARHAKALAILLKNIVKPLYFVNLITYNSTAGYEASSPESVKKFIGVLNFYNIKATERHRFGTDIDAACGQLAGKGIRLS